MKTLVIFDSTGRIYFTSSGDYVIPEGLPYIEVEVPEGQYITGVNVSGESPVAVLEKSSIVDASTLLERVELLENALNEILLN